MGAKKVGCSDYRDCSNPGDNAVDNAVRQQPFCGTALFPAG